MSTRFLRIKEHVENRVVRPVVEQLDVSNETLLDVDYKITLDENRFIVSDLNLPNQNYPKVFLCGDSIAECAFVPEGLRITDIMNAKVSEGLKKPSPRQKYEFLNAACSGNTTLHSMIVYLSKIMPLRPRHVVLLLGSIDASACRRTYNYWTPVKGTTPYNYVDVKQKFPGRLVDFSFREALLVGLNAMCKSMGGNLHVATMPITPKAEWHILKNLTNLDDVIGMREEINENTRIIAVKHNLSLIDLDLMLERSDSYFYDSEHLNAVGSEKVGCAIYEYLQSFDMH